MKSVLFFNFLGEEKKKDSDEYEKEKKIPVILEIHLPLLSFSENAFGQYTLETVFIYEFLLEPCCKQPNNIVYFQS